MPKLIDKHTLESAAAAIRKKDKAGRITVTSLRADTVVLLDSQYGEYNADIKSLCDSTALPLHRLRKHANKVEAARSKFIGTSVGGFTIIDLFYGPDRGYKNRSYIVEYVAFCGHPCLCTYALLRNRKAEAKCRDCSRITHGERAKINGVRTRRSNTYIAWVSNKAKLPVEYHDYKVFRMMAGEKPSSRAQLRVIEGKPVWAALNLVEQDVETNLIASAIRQAFRYSQIYKSAVAEARVETPDGPRYRCAACGVLSPRKDIHVDHIEPVAPINGRIVSRDELISRIWTNKIQILDRKCHSQKSTLENKARRANKKLAA